MWQIFYPRTGYCGVGGDDRVDVISAGHFGNVAHVGFVQIGRYLDRERDAPAVRSGQQVAFAGDAGKQAFQCGTFLKTSEIPCVW